MRTLTSVGKINNKSTGRGRIRTFEGISHQIYSLTPLATWVHARVGDFDTSYAATDEAGIDAVVWPNGGDISTSTLNRLSETWAHRA